MYNLGDDNELDRVSREAAGKYTPPADANWQVLSNELDKVMPVEKRKRRILFYWWLLPALLIGGATAYWLVEKNNTDDITATSKQSILTQTDKKEEKNIAPTVPANDVKKQNDPTVNGNVEKEVPNKLIATKTAKQPLTNNSSNTQERTNAGNTSLAINPKNITPSAKYQAANQPVSKAADLPAKETQVLTMAAPKTETNVSKEIVENKIDQPAKESTTTATKENKVDSVQETVTQTDATTSASPIKKNKPEILQRGKGLSFGLIAGVDKSTVKFRYSSGAGINIGVLAGYHFNDKWSIHTGAIYTQKNYKLDGADFTAPKGSWPSYYKLDNVEGYCRMWEVPLMARYTISHSNKNSFFFSTGLSSYFMTSENYDYYYYNNSGQLIMRNMAYNSTDTHILSILHLSAGFENRISKSLSLQVEPYAKIPLAGVGLGNIRLSSFGLNFSIQQRQPSKK